MCPPILHTAFHACDGFSAVHKLYRLMQSLMYFCLCGLCFWCRTHEIIVKKNVMKIFKDPSSPEDLESHKMGGGCPVDAASSWWEKWGTRRHSSLWEHWELRVPCLHLVLKGSCERKCVHQWRMPPLHLGQWTALDWGQREGPGAYSPFLTDADSEATGEDKCWSTARFSSLPSGP